MSRKQSKALAGFVIEWDVDRAGVVSNRRTYRRQGGLVLPIKELINIKALLDLPWRWKIELVAENDEVIERLTYTLEQACRLAELDSLHLDYRKEIESLLPDYLRIKTKVSVVS